LDPAALFGPVDVVREKTAQVLREAGGKPGHIFNLGHGILPATPLASVEAVLDVVRASATR
jgi:uroporphyrinogen decarboxylase